MSKWFKSLGRLKAPSRNYNIPSAPLFSPAPVKFATNLKILRTSSVVVANYFTEKHGSKFETIKRSEKRMTEIEKIDKHLYFPLDSVRPRPPA